jgi:hypothetical protein
MPTFTFDIFVTLTRYGEQIVIAKHTHSLYFTVYMALVEQLTREHVKDGWQIKSVSLQNFAFTSKAKTDLY